jgi:hypothetical protein
MSFKESICQRIRFDRGVKLDKAGQRERQWSRRVDVGQRGKKRGRGKKANTKAGFKIKETRRARGKSYTGWDAYVCVRVLRTNPIFGYGIVGYVDMGVVNLSRKLWHVRKISDAAKVWYMKGDGSRVSRP